MIIDVKHNTYCNLLSEMQMSNKTSCRGFRKMRKLKSRSRKPQYRINAKSKRKEMLSYIERY